jgi:CHASE2 domain-containing sensor protein
VSTSSSGKRGAFWRADWFVALLIVLAVLILHQATDAIGTIERRFYDFGSTSGNRQPSDRVAVIAIDDQSVANIGRWPWARDVHARLIDQLAAAKAKTIVYTTFFFEPQTDRGLAFITRIKEALGPLADSVGGPAEQAAKVIAEAERSLDTDAVLAASIARAGNVLLPSVYVLGEPQGKPDQPLPPYVARGAIDESTGSSVPAVRGNLPIASLWQAAAANGHLNQITDVDGAVRDEPLLVKYYV